MATPTELLMEAEARRLKPIECAQLAKELTRAELYVKRLKQTLKAQQEKEAKK